jgi:hypothetical protein
MRFRKASTTLAVLLGWGAVSCIANSNEPGAAADSGESVGTKQQEFNAGPAPAGQLRGHEEITKKAILYLAQRNLLPQPLMTAANQALLIYGDDFADHPWLGRPESPNTPVPNRMTTWTPSGGRIYSQANGDFQFDISLPNWDDPTVTVTAHSAVNWLPGNPSASQPNTALHYQNNLSINVDVFLSTLLNFFTDTGDGTRKAPPLDFAVDNLFHYAMGDVRDFGIAGLPADAGNLKLFPFYPEHVANDMAEWNGWDSTHKDLGNKLSQNLVNQPLVSGADFGVDKYGAILYQLARKFFVGSAAEPSLSELVKVGNSVPGWHTGNMQGLGGLNEMSMTFPHTYLGGNPHVCSGSSSTDPCAAGQPTWPVWVPETAPTLAMMEVQNPGHSDRAALIYLGWASHMMQDGSAPHHAANWTGKEHQHQDDFGDLPYFYTSTPGYEAYFVDSLIGPELDDLLGSPSEPKTRESICGSLGITDDQLLPGTLNWSAVRPAFLQNAKTAFSNRHAATVTGITAHGDAASIADGAEMVKNAILGTVKLLLCATPSSVPTAGYQNTKGAAGFVWSQGTTGTFTADSGYSYSSAGSSAANTITQIDTGVYNVDFPGLGAETGGNVQVTAYGGGSARCKVGGWSSYGGTLSTTVYCHDTSGQPVDTQFTASYVRHAGTDYGTSGGYLWADQPTTPEYTPSAYYQYNATGARNTITRNDVGQYVATFPGVDLNGGSVEVTAYGWGSEYCKVAGWGSNAVWVNCFNNDGTPADTYFTLNFTDQSPGATPSYQYAWADQPTASSYTPSPYYQKGSRARECGTDAGTVTISRNDVGNYTAILPVLSPAGSNVKVTAYGWGNETCKVVGWYGAGNGGTAVNIACYDATGQPVDTYYDFVYASNDWIIC